MKYLLGIFYYNEKSKLDKVIKKFNDYESYDVLIMDDGSTDSGLDGTDKALLSRITVLSNPVRKGIGYSVRKVFYYAKDIIKDKEKTNVINVSGRIKRVTKEKQELAIVFLKHAV